MNFSGTGSSSKPVAHETWKTREDGVRRTKVILSDLHLCAGLFWGGERNPHEEFLFDQDLCELLVHFSEGDFGDKHEVELILNGDVLDFLNIPYKGDFPEAITEELAVWKLQVIINGHKTVFDTLHEFVSKKGKTITYQVGNHDAELFFAKVREVLVSEISRGDGKLEEKVRVLHEEEFFTLDGGVEVHHGHQFEAVHVLNYKMPLLKQGLSKPVLNLPWGSFWVLKILNRLKGERDYIDKVKPVKLYFLYGLFTDPVFTLKYFFLSMFYFFKTRFVYDPRRRSSITTTIRMVKDVLRLWDDGENAAKQILERKPEVQAVIIGHTHVPRFAVFGDGRVYVNTGTWTKTINLDLKRFGTHVRRTFALVEYDGKGGRPVISLREWQGRQSVHRPFLG